jgi:hypothetical protein
MAIRKKLSSLGQKKIRASTAIVILIVVAAVLINSFILITMFRGNESAPLPAIAADNVQSSVAALPSWTTARSGCRWTST